MARGLQVKYVHSAVVCKRSHMVALPCVHLKRDCKLRVGFALLMRTSDHQSRRPAKWDGEDRHPCPSSLNVGVGHFSGGGGSEFRGSEKNLAWIRPDICLDLCQFDISSSYHQLCGILPLPQPTLHCFCLLLFVFFPLLPPLLKFCLAHRHWPLLAQSWDRRREHTQMHKNLYQFPSFVASVPSIHPVLLTKRPGGPLGIFLPALPTIICPILWRDFGNHGKRVCFGISFLWDMLWMPSHLWRKSEGFYIFLSFSSSLVFFF